MKRIIDARIWKTGHSFVITLPYTLVKKFKLKAGDIIEIEVRK